MSEQTEVRRRLGRRYIALTGFLLVALSVTAWILLSIAIAGPSVFLSSYHDYLGAMRASGTTSIYAWLQFSMGLGMVFLGATSRERTSLLGAAIFLFVFVPLAFPLGLRGEVLFPLVAYSVLFFRERKAPSPALVIAPMVLLLSLISFVKIYRQPDQVWQRSPSGKPGFWFNPFDAVAEMGASLRPIAEVLEWQKSGMKLMYGESYWAPIDRALFSIFTVNGSAGGADLRLPNVLVAERVGPIGFSTVAEAVLNFGILGPLVVMAVVGALVAYFEKAQLSVFGLALWGTVFLELVGTIRGVFVAVPAHLLIALVIIGTVQFVVNTRSADGTTRKKSIEGAWQGERDQNDRTALRAS